MVPAPAPQVAAPVHSGSASAPNSRVLGAYYPSWKIYKGSKPSDLRLSLLTHVYYAFARVQDDGAIYSLDPKADSQLAVDGAQGCLGALTKLKREQNPHLRVLLSIGGGSGSAQFPAVAADPAKTRRFCETARDMVLRYELDGVDIDWEHPTTPAHGASFAALMRALRAYFPAPKHTLTAALPAGEWSLRNIDLGALLTASPQKTTMDYINIMAYDFAGPWTGGQAGHQAQLNAPANPHNAFAKRSIAEAVRYLTQEQHVPAGRLVVGIPAYGRSFLGAAGPGDKAAGHGGDADGTFEYRALPRPGAVEGVDKAAGAAFCRGGDGGFVSYDNPETVGMKGAFVLQQGLAGMFLWTGSFDSPDNERSLAVAAHKALSKGPA